MKKNPSLFEEWLQQKVDAISPIFSPDAYAEGYWEGYDNLLCDFQQFAKKIEKRQKKAKKEMSKLRDEFDNRHSLDLWNKINEIIEVINEKE